MEEGYLSHCSLRLSADEERYHGLYLISADGRIGRKDRKEGGRDWYSRTNE